MKLFLDTKMKTAVLAVGVICLTMIVESRWVSNERALQYLHPAGVPLHGARKDEIDDRGA